MCEKKIAHEEIVREREQRKKKKEGIEVEIEKVRQGKEGYYYTVSLQHLSRYNYDIEIETKLIEHS